MVILENVTKLFGAKPVIQNLSLKVEEGEIFTLLGESGCGKTTLLRLIAGFEQPDNGRISIGGEDMLPLPVERRPVGFIFQSHALFPHLTVYDNIAVGPRIRKLSEDELRKRIEALLEITRLQDSRRAYPGSLSGGESQRVAIARAIVNRPKMLLLDEPLSALDPKLRQSLREELAEMQRTFGITFLFVTHDQEEAMSISTRIGIMDKGSLSQVGRPDELYDRPATPYVARFLGEVNRLRGTVERQSGDRATIQLQGLGHIECKTDNPQMPDKKATIYIRPENIFLSAKAELGDLPNKLEGEIVSGAFHGNHTRYKVKLRDGSCLNIQTRHDSRGGREEQFFRIGDRVRALFRPESVFLFDAEDDHAG